MLLQCHNGNRLKKSTLAFIFCDVTFSSNATPVLSYASYEFSGRGCSTAAWTHRTWGEGGPATMTETCIGIKLHRVSLGPLR